MAITSQVAFSSYSITPVDPDPQGENVGKVVTRKPGEITCALTGLLNIGSHTAKYLSRQGLEPVVLDNLSVGHRSQVRWGPLVECDLADREMLGAVLLDYRIDAVIHCAAHCYVGESIARPAEYFRNNIANTLNLLDAMREAGIRTIIFSSSCATYGIPSQTPIREEAPQQPINPYGESNCSSRAS